jgi:hypothetical protein
MNLTAVHYNVFPESVEFNLSTNGARADRSIDYPLLLAYMMQAGISTFSDPKRRMPFSSNCEASLTGRQEIPRSEERRRSADPSTADTVVKYLFDRHFFFGYRRRLPLPVRMKQKPRKLP